MLAREGFMGLSKEQYDEIMRGYYGEQNKNRNERLRRQREISLKVPEIDRISGTVSDAAVTLLKRRLLQGEEIPDTAHRKMASVVRQKRQILKENGYPEDYLDEIYTCKNCRDTGYVNGKKCRCFTLKEIDLLYKSSNLRELVKENCFEKKTEAYYRGEGLEKFRKAVEKSREFVKNFDKDYRNMLYYGTTGVGKTFLSLCIAKELLDSGHSVLFFAAEDLFGKLDRWPKIFRKQEDLARLEEDIRACDLLIIDDLGTERDPYPTAVRLSELITERKISRKPIIITTNLTLEDIQKVYKDRVFSRIIDSFDFYRLIGKDIRIRNKKRRVDEEKRMDEWRLTTPAANWRSPYTTGP